MNHANLFVVHTRFHILVVDHMIETIREFSGTDNILVLDMEPGPLLFNHHHWKLVLALEPVGGTVLGGKERCLAALQKLAEISGEYNQVSVFLSDIQWPLNNAIYGQLIAHRTKDFELCNYPDRIELCNYPDKIELCNYPDRIELCNYPDGIGNIFVQYPTLTETLKNAVKSMLCFCGGTPYYMYRGDMFGLHQSDRIYSLMPDAIPESFPHVIKIPPFVPVQTFPEPDTCLFLGQHSDDHLSPKQYQKLCAMEAEFVHKLGYHKLLFKPHPMDTSGKEWAIFAQYGFELFSDPRPVEEIFLTRQIGCVVSCFTSALAHLKMMFGAEIRCISCFCNRFERHQSGKIMKLFKSCGVECYE